MSLEHILLGYLQAPSTGYDLGREFEEGARHFWFAELSQIYPTLKRLEERGWLTSEEAPSRRGPKRRVYQLTEDGRAELRSWLAAGPHIGRDRLGYIAQACFLAALEDAEAATSVIRRMQGVWRGKLAWLEEGERELLEELGPAVEMSNEAFHPFSALRLGVHQYKAKLAWCEEVLEQLDRRADGTARKED